MQNHKSLTIVSVGLLFIVGMIGCEKDQKVTSRRQQESDRAEEKSPMQPDRPISFGYKIHWLAVRTNDPQAVIKSLGLTNVEESNWQRGFQAAYGGQVFVTPAIDGWVLVASISLPEITEGRNDVPVLLTKLGKEFADVQYFGTHRVVGYHGWARAINGELTRQYAYLGESGETLRDEGDPTAEEKLLHLVYDKSAPAFKDDNSPDEEDVMKLAAAWSINPNALETMGLPKSLGFVGNLPAKLQRS
jgi:hypothetical protein